KECAACGCVEEAPSNQNRCPCGGSFVDPPPLPRVCQNCGAMDPPPAPPPNRRPRLYGDFRACLPTNPDFIRIFRRSLAAADALALDRLTHFACELFGQSEFTDKIFARLDPWLRIQDPPPNNAYVSQRAADTGDVDEYGLTLIEVAEMLEAEVNRRKAPTDP